MNTPPKCVLYGAWDFTFDGIARSDLRIMDADRQRLLPSQIMQPPIGLPLKQGSETVTHPWRCTIEFESVIVADAINSPHKRLLGFGCQHLSFELGKQLQI